MEVPIDWLVDTLKNHALPILTSFAATLATLVMFAAWLVSLGKRRGRTRERRTEDKEERRVRLGPDTRNETDDLRFLFLEAIESRDRREMERIGRRLYREGFRLIQVGGRDLCTLSSVSWKTANTR